MIHRLSFQWGNLCNAFLKEAKWFADGVIPAADEYLKNGLVSSGVHVLSVHMFYLLGFGVTNNESSINLEDTSAMASSGAMILRLWDDLGSAKVTKKNIMLVYYFFSYRDIEVTCEAKFKVYKF